MRKSIVLIQFSLSIDRSILLDIDTRDIDEHSIHVHSHTLSLYCDHNNVYRLLIVCQMLKTNQMRNE